jgi:chemosensory pili system protein ChpA (sensor histidine kinase/response regulator)
MHSREVVIKSLSPWIDGRNGIIGATHLPNGSVAPVLNLPKLLNLTEDTTSFITTYDAEVVRVDTSRSSDTPLILVVDDSLSNRKALSLIIDQTEYDVVTAVDGLDALNIMNEKKVSMVFTDLEMPRMNGLEFTQSVRAWKENKHIPVIMVTSRTTSKHRQLAEKAGVDDYLTKPVVTDTLLDSIEQWVTKKPSVPA